VVVKWVWGATDLEYSIWTLPRCGTVGGTSTLDSATDKSYAFAFPSPEWWCNQHATHRVKKSINMKYIQSHKYPKICKQLKVEALLWIKHWIKN